jgi:putative ABC transport system permease protein
MNLNVILRRIYKYKAYFLVNILGLSLAFISVFMISAFVWKEFSYDRFHANANRIVRVTLNTNTGKSSLIDARISGGFAPYLKQKYPEIESYNRLMSWRKATVIIGENSFYNRNTYSVDSGFFDFFSFKLLSGDKEHIFTKPGQLAISESMAKTYFGTIDVIGKQIQIIYQRKQKPDNLTIMAVFEDFPENSHFTADFLCSYFNNNRPPDWTYSYLLLTPDCNIDTLQNKIQAEMDSTNAQREVKSIYNLQALKDIHFYSHKSRELKQNANIQSVILLISGALIILIIALINFTNLNYVQFLRNRKSIKIRIVNGASRFSLSIDLLKDVLVLSVIVVVVSFIGIRYLSNLFGIHFIEELPQNIAIGFAIVFVILIIFFAFIPSLFWRYDHNLTRPIANSRGVYKISLVIQLALSIVAIISSFVIFRQINYINSLHPQASNSHIILIPDNVGAVVRKYDTFKESLLRHSEIIAVTAASEPPAGIVTDNFKFSYNNEKSDDHRTLNTMIIDTSFFNFLNIKPLAGTVNIRNTASNEWEHNALKVWQLNYMKKKVPEDLAKEVARYSDKYIVNRTALKIMGVDKPEDAVGKNFQLIHPMTELFPKGKVIAVVDDFHYTNMFVDEKPLVMVCRRIFCHNFLINFNPNQQHKALETLKAEWENNFQDIPLQFEFITDAYHKVYKSEYYEMKVLMLFSFISLMLSLIGIFATLSFNLKRRTKEIGIRKVNGASVWEIIYLFNVNLLKSFLIAFVIAIPLVYYAMSIWLTNFAYKTQLSWWIFVLSAILVLLIMIVTVSLQTFLYARRNPIESLRYE